MGNTKHHYTKGRFVLCLFLGGTGSRFFFNSTFQGLAVMNCWRRRVIGKPWLKWCSLVVFTCKLWNDTKKSNSSLCFLLARCCSFRNHTFSCPNEIRVFWGLVGFSLLQLGWDLQKKKWSGCLFQKHPKCIGKESGRAGIAATGCQTTILHTSALNSSPPLVGGLFFGGFVSENSCFCWRSQLIPTRQYMDVSKNSGTPNHPF